VSIVEFLKARISEDEAVARAAVGNDGPPTWLQDDTDGVYGARPDVDWDEVCQSHTYGVPNECDFNPTACGISMTDDPVLEHARARHIARHDPARVLAECAAKRHILDDHAPFYAGSDLCGGHDGRHTLEQCDLRRAMASVYADHPDFQEEWRV